MTKKVGSLLILALAAAVAGGCEDRLKPVETSAGFTVGPAALSFGEVFVGEQLVHRVEVENTGKADALDIDVAGSPAGFAVEPAVFTVAPGQKQTVVVTFRPETAGPVAGVVLFRASESGLAAEVAVEGVGVVRKVRVAEELDFGSVPVGGSRTLPLVLSNESTTSLEVSVESPPDRSFAVDPSSFSLDPGSELTVAVAFSPEVRGTAESTVAFLLCEDCKLLRVGLAGRGVEALLTASPDPVAFEPAAVGLRRRQVVTIANTGDLDLEVSSVRVEGEPFALNGENEIGHLPVGAATEVEVSFTPLAEGSYQGTLEVEGKADGVELRRLLSVRLFGGTGGPLLVASPARLDFVPLYVGLAPLRQTVTLTNVGDPAPLSLVSATIEDQEGDEGFRVEYEPLAPIEPSASVTVVFDPGEAKAYSGRLVLRTDAPGQEELSIPLSGLAKQPSPCPLRIRADTIGMDGHEDHTVTYVDFDRTGSPPSPLQVMCDVNDELPCGPCVFSNPRIAGPDARYFKLERVYQASYPDLVFRIEAEFPFLLYADEDPYLASQGLFTRVSMTPDTPKEVLLHASFLYELNGVTHDFYLVAFRTQYQ